MNQLFPIIRRKRRSLLPVESLADRTPFSVAADNNEPSAPDSQSLLTSAATGEKPHDDEAAEN
jgi:hypothetical protein